MSAVVLSSGQSNQEKQEETLKQHRSIQTRTNFRKFSSKLFKESENPIVYDFVISDLVTFELKADKADYH